MAETNTVARTVRDLGLAKWFGRRVGIVAVAGAALARRMRRGRS